MPEVLVSVAMTTYNHEKYIRSALDSVLMQKTDFRYEIVIGEDCSTDNTKAIVEEYARKYPDIIKPIFHEENVGGRRNAYEVKHRCMGKYIAYLEGDDYWTDENKLRKQVEFLEANPEYIAVVHRYQVVDAQGKSINKRSFGDYTGSGDYTIENFMNSELPSQLATYLIRNIYKDNYEKYEEYLLRDNTIQGDIKMTFLLTAQGKIYRMEDKMSAYRLVQAGGGNFTSLERKNPKFFRKWEQVCELERYAKEEWDIDLYMKYHRREYSSRTLLNVLRSRSRESVLDAVRILKSEKKAVSYFMSYVVLKYVLRKI